MNTVRRLVKNSGVSLITQVSTPLCSFVLVFFIARILGASGLGQFSSAMALFFIFQAFSSLGFLHFITRQIARDKSQAGKYLVNASCLGLAISIPMMLLMCLVAHVMTDSVDTVRAVYILSIALIPYTIIGVFTCICKGFERFEFVSIPVVSGNIFKVGFGMFFLMNGYGLPMLMVVITASHFVTLIISLLFTLKCISQPISEFSELFKIDLSFCMSILKATFIFALIPIVCAIRFHIDVLILNNMMGDQEVGIYSAALKLVNITNLGIACYLMALQPVIYKLYKSSLKKFGTVCTESIRYLYIMILPIITGVTILSDRFILLIFDQEFLLSANVLCILIWMLIFGSINRLFATVLFASNNQKINLHANIISMIFAICMNLLLIPVLGCIGAGIATIASSFTTLVYQHFFVKKYLFKVKYFQHAVKPFIAAAIMGIFVLRFKGINLFILISVSAAVYIVGLLIIKTFSVRDLDLLQRLWKGEEGVGASKS